MATTSNTNLFTNHRLRWIAALLIALSGCSSIPHPAEPKPVVVVKPPASDFTIAAEALDSWNAVGQLLVREHGLTYEGRSQMLGLYDVDYRGERFLVLTRAMVLSADTPVTTTDIRVTLRDGKPDVSDAAIALLGILQAKLPDELKRIAAEVKTQPPVKKPVRKKRRHK